jgi:hypothetical protein
MFAAASLVFLVTYTSESLGPRLCGLLGLFPVAGTILAGFTHYNCGADDARKLLDGFLKGLFGMAVFNLIFSLQLSSLGLSATVLIAFVAAVLTSSAIQQLTERRTIVSP